jgi:hypothetical protein
MNVKILKLVTGEEVVGELVSETDSTVTLKNTVALVIQPTQQGLQMGFIPWASTIEGDVALKKSDVIYSGPAKDDLKNNYSSMFGGIVTPPKTLITG